MIIYNYSQAYCNIIAGACMALGLRYAGTANINAFKTLYNYAQMFMALSHKTIAELAGKSTVETCLNVVLLSTAVVMAGTGNLDVSLNIHNDFMAEFIDYLIYIDYLI